MKTTKHLLLTLLIVTVSAFVLCGCNNITDNSPEPQKKNSQQIQANKQKANE